MGKTITITALQKRISRELRRVGSTYKLAAQYSDEHFKMNHRYICDVLHGREIKNQEVRYRLGLDQRPKPAWLGIAVSFLRRRDSGFPISGSRVYSRKGKLVKG